MQHTNYYFLTDFDSNYTTQGSRDPLGLQTIWVAAARKLISYLSTVSVSARDFQILSYARYYCIKKKDLRFRNFFPFLYRFEQACAYARYHIQPKDRSFSGIEKISNKVINDNICLVSHKNPACFLLSNQRSYGIYGRYYRPYIDAAIEIDHDFREVMEAAFQKTTDTSSLLKLMDKLFDAEEEHGLEINETELVLLSELIKKKLPQENSFFIRKLLHIDSRQTKAQNILYDLLDEHPNLLPANNKQNFNLYTFIDKASAINSNENLNNALEEIKNTEQLIYPLHAMFAHFLDAKPIWTKEDINKNDFFRLGFDPVPYNYAESDDNKNDLRNQLNAQLAEDISPYERIQYLIERHNNVCEKRGRLPWVKCDNDKIIILNKGAKPPKTINQQVDSNFSYFIPSYLQLFTELKRTTQNSAL